MVKHIMFLKVMENDDASDNIEQIKDELLAIANESNGIISAEVGYNFSMDDYDLVFTSSFKNPAALKHFQTNAAFLKVKALLDSVCDTVTCADYICESDNMVDKSDVTSNEKKTSAQKKNNTVSKSTKTAQSKSTAKATTKSAPKAVKVEETAKESVNLEPVEEKPVDPKPILDSAAVKPVTTESTPKKVYTTYAEDIKVTPIYDDENIQTEPVVKKEPAKKAPAKKTTSKSAKSSGKKDEDDIVIKRIEPKGTSIKEGESAMEEAWKCPVCGKINGNFVGLCGCGADKPEFYTPLTPQEVAIARQNEEPEDNSELPVLKNNMLLPSMDDLENIIRPAITKTVIAIKKSAYDIDELPDELRDKDESHVTAAAKAAANIEAEDKVELKRIEPKGKQIKDGESAMEDAWRCPICSKINGAFVGICGCGVHRPEEYTPVPLEEIKAEEIKNSSKSASKSTVNKESYSTEEAYDAMINSKKSSAIKSITDTITTVTNKSIQTITDAMNNADTESSTSSTKKKKEISYNEKLLSSDDTEDTVKLKKIEPKGSAPKNGESAMKNSWICPTCGKENASYIGKCGCGCTKTPNRELA